MINVKLQKLRKRHEFLERKRKKNELFIFRWWIPYYYDIELFRKSLFKKERDNML